jgi:hypothetical protein
VADSILVHPRISRRHPEIKESDVIHAWTKAIKWSTRIGSDKQEHVAIGFDEHSRLLEMVGVPTADDCWLIYHAMTPPSKKTLRELGLLRR